MTTHDPDTGERDHDTPGDPRVSRQTEEKDILFGVWGEVEQAGTIRLGDEVRVLAG